MAKKKTSEDVADSALRRARPPARSSSRPRRNGSPTSSPSCAVDTSSRPPRLAPVAGSASSISCAARMAKRFGHRVRPNCRPAAPRSMVIEPKFVGARALVERCVVTLAGERGLLLVGQPGTAKSMLGELLAAAISGSSALTIQGTAGANEDHLRYGWNYAMLLDRGPSRRRSCPSPVLTGMRTGKLVRIEEITRCLPEVQDALISVLSERRMMIPELEGRKAVSSPCPDSTSSRPPTCATGASRRCPPP